MQHQDKAFEGMRAHGQRFDSSLPGAGGPGDGCGGSTRPGRLASSTGTWVAWGATTIQPRATPGWV